jgi:hypothetical protein
MTPANIFGAALEREAKHTPEPRVRLAIIVRDKQVDTFEVNGVMTQHVANLWARQWYGAAAIAKATGSAA